MRQHRKHNLAGSLYDPVGITAAPGHDADRANPAGPFTKPTADIKMPSLLWRDHGEDPLPGMMFLNKSRKLAALRPN